jgi:hypothetical protein
MNANRLFQKFFGTVVFLLPGLAMVCYVLAVEVPRAVDEYGPHIPLSEIGGLLALVAFGLVFVFIGYLQVSDSAGAKAMVKFADWNKGFRFGFFAFLAVGLAGLAMAFSESLFYLFFGIPFTVVGILGLYRYYSKENLRRDLPRTGRKITCTDIAVERDPITRGYVLGSNEQLTPFLIKCTATEPGSTVPFVFVSEPIWFDPKPFLKESIMVYANPKKITEYVVDISFLPAETRKIYQRTFSFS